MATPEAHGEPRTLTTGLRTLLVVAGSLVLLTGLQLFAFPQATDRYFAWTVQPAMTAVFLGAAFWSSMVLEWSAARRTYWSDARIAVPSVLVFTALTLLATVLHLAKFHLGAEFAAGTRVVAFAWLVLYALVPVLLALLLVDQTRRPGTDPPRLRPLGRATASVVGVQAALLLVVGTVLFITPSRAIDWWPWALTPLTGRAVGAWCVGLGVAAAHALWESDVHRLRPAANAFAVFGVLQVVALVRYGGELDWDATPAPVYVAFLLSTVGVGLTVLVRARGSDRADRGDAGTVTSRS